MFQKMPVILLAIILAVVFLGDFIPPEVKLFLYAISSFIKSVIIFLLPIIIFSLLFKSTLTLAHNATRVILIILLAVCLSNFLSTFLSHYVGMWIYGFDLSNFSTPVSHNNLSLEGFWSIQLPTLIKNDYAMFAGIIFGIIAGIFKPGKADIIAQHLEKIVNKILYSFIYLIPLFVTGFLIKLQNDGVMDIIIEEYALIFVIVALAQFSYIALMYLIANNFKVSAFVNSIKNMLPASIVAFSTMSSAATMPLTIIGTDKNVKNKDIARAVIPTTVNIHLVGDCFAITIFAYAVMKNYGVAEPTLIEYLIYAFYFVIAKFSVAGVPGGGILIMLPILEEHLGFHGEMLSLITALYILLDPLITVANVTGNGAFAMIMDKFKFLKSSKNEET